MRPAQQTTTDSHLARLGGAAPALGLFAAAMWLAWLGWDHEFYRVDGVRHGPYRSWQVVGCGLSIATVAALAQVWVRRVEAIFVLTAAAVIGFAVPWAGDASTGRDSGMWLVGLVFLVSGSGLGLMALLAVVAAVASRPHPRRRTHGPARAGRDRGRIRSR